MQEKPDILGPPGRPDVPNTRKYEKMRETYEKIREILQKYVKIRENVAKIRGNTRKYRKTRIFCSPGGILAPPGGPEGPDTRKYEKIRQNTRKYEKNGSPGEAQMGRRRHEPGPSGTVGKRLFGPQKYAKT